jgi:GTP-binding protein Era
MSKLDEEIISKELEEEIQEEVDRAFDKEFKDINEQLDQEINFVLVGDINTGKSSTVNRLMEKELASVAPEPGQTVEVGSYYYTDKIVFIDTPGLDDIYKKNSEQTIKFFKKADVILFFLNAAGTVLSDGEKKVYEKIKKKNDNIIFVLNKIDAIEQNEIPYLQRYIKRNTSNNHPVIPISSKLDLNIGELREAILDMVKKKR